VRGLLPGSALSVTQLEVRAEGLAERFTALTGRGPAGVWAAPGRVNLIGEHTDYNEGFVLPVALDRATLAAVAPRRNDAAHCWSTNPTSPQAVSTTLDAAGPGGPTGWSAYVLGVLWALMKEGVQLPGFDVLVDTNVPLGAGLSSSAALECAITLAATDLAGATLDRSRLAQVARRAENEVVGAPTGVMDQMAAMHGGRDAAVFLDCRSLVVRRVPLELTTAGLTLVIINTGVAHSLVDGQYADRRAACEQAARLLDVPALRDATPAMVERARNELGELLWRRSRHVVSEDERVLDVVRLLESGRAGEIGSLLDASHASLRDDFEVSCEELDVAVEAATSAGAFGARMTGGGFGGSAVALVPVDEVSAVRDAVGAAYRERHFAAPEVFEVVASDGARRIR
jgi:galactokinase